MRPTLGRIVHVRVDGEWYAAVVVEVVNDDFWAQMFAVDRHLQGCVEWRCTSEEGKAWRWPPREGGAERQECAQ